MSEFNPLLAPIGALLDYAAIRPEHVDPAVTQLLAEARAAVDKAADASLPATWEAIQMPLDDASERLGRAWSAVGHLNGVVNTPALREAYNAALPAMTEFSTWVGLHEGLYKQYLRMQAAEGFAQWPAERKRAVELSLRGFRLSGVELQGEDRERYAEISDAQAQAGQKFSENVLDAMDAWAYFETDEARLEGIPADVLAAAAQAAQADGKTGWKLTLKMPCYLPVMQYARDRALREKLYRGYGTLASDQAEDSAHDNTALIQEILTLRAQESKLLGFDTFATLQLQTRMARQVSEVTDFLGELAKRAKPYAQQDLAQLREFAKQELSLSDLQPWDVAFASERLRESRYAYSEDEVKQYFTEPRVLEGWSEVIGRLFGVRLVSEPQASTWHKDVRPYRVLDDQGQERGFLYLDLYARAGKQSGAWVDCERSRRGKPGQPVRTPVVFLTCNFSAPGENTPSLLTHDDVITLFHEGGHALHALLDDTNEPEVSAFSAVEWDAIELPSQFMENFCWEWPVVEKLSAHVKTGEPLPRALYDKLYAAKNYHSGMQTVRQVELALFDMRLHAAGKGMTLAETMDVLKGVRDEVSVMMPPVWARLPHTFSHIFAGGYAAGYYSYKWAEVLSADAYAAFEESADGDHGTLDPRTGAQFRREILAAGGARPAAASFQAFRGRDPSIDALLRHSGMGAESVTS